MDPAKELLQEAIRRVDVIRDHLDRIEPLQAKALLLDIVKDLKAGFVGVTGENLWK